MTVDLNLIRRYLDELQVPTLLDDDGDLVVTQAADSDFEHKVLIFITVNNGRVSYSAGAPDYAPEGDLLYLVNRHNLRSIMPMAVVRNDAIRMEYTFVLDEEVSESYIKNNCIVMILSAIWHAFLNLEREI